MVLTLIFKFLVSGVKSGKSKGKKDMMPGVDPAGIRDSERSVK